MPAVPKPELETKQKSVFECVGICEGFIETDDPDDQLEAWQYLIDTGVIFQLQGNFQRMAQSLSDEGLCRPAPIGQEVGGNDE